MSEQRCFHCSEPLPTEPLTVTIRGREERVCCPGCRVVAGLIADSGLGEYYRFRTAASRRPPEGLFERSRWDVYERPALRERLTRVLDNGRLELRCGVAGITCSACVWLIEEALERLDGVESVSVNPVSQQVTIELDPKVRKPSEVLAAIAALGFEPRPKAGSRSTAARAARERAELKRLAVAGLGFVQVMMLAAALYIGGYKDMDPTYTRFFELVSMLVATPVVIYAGAPIFASAWFALGRYRLGMDVPVALAIVAAAGASLFDALRGRGPVYFDSVTMFVFFLTLGRFLEARARRRAGSELEELADLLPASALRKQGDGLERVGTTELALGDIVVVPPGGALPADGRLVSGEAALDESLTSGESAARRRLAGERVLGGALNAGTTPIEIEVAAVGAASYLEQVGALLDRAIADRPGFVRLADRWAGTFVAGVLAATALAGLLWWRLAPARAFDVALAMLVATCPCALSLATPTAFAAALSALAKRGVLLKSSRVLERVGRVSHWLIDKTGTLTTGQVELLRVDPVADLDPERCRAVAAALEAGIDHPLARAFAQTGRSASEVEYTAGSGVTGVVDGERYRLGSARYTGAEAASGGNESELYLRDSRRVVARFVLSDTLRPSARTLIARLTAQGYRLALVSGDRLAAVASVARRLGVCAYRAEQSPVDKLDGLRALRREGAVVAAVGDGVNDAPLLAAADVSIAVNEGSRLAQASADIVFTGRDLGVLAELPRWAERTQRVVRQNLAWAVGYNALALSLAAAGLITPWLAALGMSASSLIVVGNALRLRRGLAPGTAALERRPLVSEAS